MISFTFWQMSLFWWRDKYLKKLIGRKSVSLYNIRIPAKRNWSFKNMAWDFFFLSSPAAFLKLWNDSMVLKTGGVSCSAIVKLPVLPEACVIPCWEKLGERENVISNCMWAMVWEMSSILCASGPCWQHPSWGGVTEQLEHEEPQAPMASALLAHVTLLSDASCSALYGFRHYVGVGNRAGLLSRHLLTVLLGYMVEGRLKSKRMEVQNPGYLKKKTKTTNKKVFECHSSPILPFRALKL